VRPLLRQFEALHERFDRLDRQNDLLAQGTAHLAGYLGKVETEVHELRTQVSVDVEVIAELARLLQRIVRELEPLAPELRALCDEVQQATARAASHLAGVGDEAPDSHPAPPRR